MELSDVTHNYWQSRWKNDDVRFHKLEPNEYLVAHKDVLLCTSTTGCRLFIPLCGKTVDLIYLENCGYDVFGCEFVEKPVIDFFEEQKLEYTKSELSKDVFIYKASRRNITIYQCDLFALSSSLIGKFDAIWDRGSIIAIDPNQRKEYARLMKEFMAPNCKYLLYTVVVGGDFYEGPPHTIHHNEIKNLFSNFCDIKQLEVKNTTFYHPDAESFTVTVDLLSRK